MTLNRILAGQLGDADAANDDPTARVLVRDLVVDARIGVYRHEKARAQRVRFNIALDVRLPGGDRLGDVVSYQDVVDGIRRILDRGHINLVETLAERVAQMALADRRVLVARVRVEKLDILGEGGAVGVEIERRAPRPPVSVLPFKVVG